MNSLYCGIDYHKNTCTLCFIDEDGKELELSVKNTTNVVKYLANYKNLIIGVEASGGVNYFVDRLKASGHQVKIIDPKAFRLVGLGGKKTDKRDAQAIAKALRAGFIPEVHHKSGRSRQIKSLLVSRELTVNSRVNIFNHIRGTLREYGLPIPQGKKAFLEQVKETINKVENGYIRNTLFSLLNVGMDLIKEEEEIESRLLQFTKNDPKVKMLQTLPGVGPMTSLALIAVADDISRFKNANFFASYLGLVPRENSSGDKRILGSITRSGSEILRRYLIHGARSVLKHVKQQEGDPNKAWAFRLQQRVGMNKATVALAHRHARISFAMLRDETSYGEIKLKEESQSTKGKNAA